MSTSATAPSPVAPSVVPFEGQAFTKNGWVPVSPHRALAIEEIAGLVESFRRAAERAKAAGMDGVELHNANGYLADTFLQDGTNKRTDRYGGSIENRMRFSTELVEALVSVWGPGRVGVRVSPSGQWGSISDSDPEATFGAFAERLNRYPLAYLHVIEPRVKGVETIGEGHEPVASAFLRRIYKGPIIAAGGFDRAGAEAILQRGDADLVAFGRFFTSNPDLPERLRRDLPLTPYHREAFWGGTERWYSDFRTSSGARGRSLSRADPSTAYSHLRRFSCPSCFPRSRSAPSPWATASSWPRSRGRAPPNPATSPAPSCRPITASAPPRAG